MEINGVNVPVSIQVCSSQGTPSDLPLNVCYVEAVQADTKNEQGPLVRKNIVFGLSLPQWNPSSGNFDPPATYPLGVLNIVATIPDGVKYLVQWGWTEEISNMSHRDEVHVSYDQSCTYLNRDTVDRYLWLHNESFHTFLRGPQSQREAQDTVHIHNCSEDTAKKDDALGDAATARYNYLNCVYNHVMNTGDLTPSQTTEILLDLCERWARSADPFMDKKMAIWCLNKTKAWVQQIQPTTEQVSGSPLNFTMLTDERFPGEMQTYNDNQQGQQLPQLNTHPSFDDMDWDYGDGIFTNQPQQVLETNTCASLGSMELANLLPQGSDSDGSSEDLFVDRFLMCLL